MFRVHENGDGSTSIFCSDTGRLICTIRGQQKNMGLGCRPVNIVEPSPKTKACCYDLDLKSTSTCLSDEEGEQKKREKNSKSVTWDEPKEDYYENCITPEEFARCLNLVPTEKLKNEALDQLNADFPLRHLSRTKKIIAKENLQDVKPPDVLPLTSVAGRKILKLSQQKNFSCEQNIELKIKDYDNFCRFQIDTASVASNLPKLRCREKKDYPVCIPHRILRYAPSHIYAFNKRQRLEKLITFKTGILSSIDRWCYNTATYWTAYVLPVAFKFQLFDFFSLQGYSRLDTQSRKLLLRCNKRLAVYLKRLNPEEINTWLQKRSRCGPLTADCIKAEEPASSYSNSSATVIQQNSPEYIDIVDSSDSDSSDSNDKDPSFTEDPSFKYRSHRDAASFKGALNSSKNSLSSPNKKYGQLTKWLNNSPRFKNCSVRLKNVLREVQKYSGGYYYIAKTIICIPFFEDFLNSIDRKVLSSIVIPETKQLSNSRHYHAYRRLFSQVTQKKKLFANSQCLNHETLKTKNIRYPIKVSNGVRKKSNSVKLNNVKDSNLMVNKPSLSVIPIIDLTNDSAPNSPVKESQKGSWKFHCYGCNFNQKFLQQRMVYPLATKHMKDFHCVSDVRAFLKVDRSGSTLEAFPGYKGGTNK